MRPSIYFCRLLSAFCLPYDAGVSPGDFVIDPRATGFVRLDVVELFGNRHRVVLEIGSGKGRFLISAATEQPEVNFIGIEKSLHYHRVIRDRVVRRGLPNIRLINHDAFLVLREMLSDASVDEIHIYFPDPWPRKREQKRRIIRAEVLTEIRRVLVPGGSGIYVTDHRDYYEAAAPVVEQFFRSERRIPGPDDPPRTNYEAKFRQAGREIYEVRFWKSEEVRSVILSDAKNPQPGMRGMHVDAIIRGREVPRYSNVPRLTTTRVKCAVCDEPLSPFGDSSLHSELSASMLHP